MSVACDEGLAERVREAVGPCVERAMFGGLAFLVDGHMACGVLGDELVVRVGLDAYEAALARPHARPMDFTGKPLRGYVYVEAGGLESDEALAAWVARGVAFVATLPPKGARPARRKRKTKRRS